LGGWVCRGTWCNAAWICACIPDVVNCSLNWKTRIDNIYHSKMILVVSKILKNRKHLWDNQFLISLDFLAFLKKKTPNVAKISINVVSIDITVRTTFSKFSYMYFFSGKYQFHYVLTFEISFHALAVQSLRSKPIYNI
jgi:hypothetical protein